MSEINGILWVVWSLIMALVGLAGIILNIQGMKDLVLGYAIVAGILFFIEWALEVHYGGYLSR